MALEKRSDPAEGSKMNLSVLHHKAAELMKRISETGSVNDRDRSMAGIFATQLERRRQNLATFGREDH